MSSAKENVPKSAANGNRSSAASAGGDRTGAASLRGGKAHAPRPAESKKPTKRKKEIGPYEPDSKVWCVFLRDNTLREAIVLARDLLHKPAGYTKKSCTEVSTLSQAT